MGLGVADHCTALGLLVGQIHAVALAAASEGSGAEEEGEEEDEFDEEKEAAAVLAEVQSESAQISVNVARYTVTVGTAEGAQGHTGIAPPYVGEEMFESSEYLVGLCQ
jgi:hypothetical protein